MPAPSAIAPPPPLRAAEPAGRPPSGIAAHALSADRGFEADLAEHAAAGLLVLTARHEDGGRKAGLAEVAAVGRRAGRGCAATAPIPARRLTPLRTAARFSLNALRAEPDRDDPALVRLRRGVPGLPGSPS